MKEVVISGIGCITHAGLGLDALVSALQDPRPRFSEVDRSGGYHLPCSARFGASAAAHDTSRWLTPLKARRMSPPSRLAVVAAKMALEDAGLDARPSGDPRMAVILGTGYGPVTYSERILLQIFEEGPQGASPALFTESVANAPAAQVALQEKALGTNVTLTAREAGALQAVGMGADEILSGRAERALVGGVEELNPLLHAVLDRYHALARDVGRGEVPRPFDLHRNGCVAGEGATVLLLEDAASARAADRQPYATVAARARAFDPTARPTSWGRAPERICGRLRAQVERRGASLDTIDLVVSGASGLRAGDAAAAAILRCAFRDRPLPPVLTPAAWLGAYCGNTLAAAILGLGGATVCATPGFETVDPQLAMQPYDGALLPAARSVLVESTAVGGSVAWLLLGAAARERAQPGPGRLSQGYVVKHDRNTGESA